MKIGIVGSGKIVENVLAALSKIEEITCTSICVREKSLDKGKCLSNEYGIDNIFTDYNEFLSSNDFEFVYIGLLNPLHYEYAKKALLSGKNVICEKPFTTRLCDLEELVILAKEKNLFIFEAISTIHMPNYKYLKRILPDLKNVKLVQANFSQYSSRYDDYLNGDVHPVFSWDDFGGALHDMNVYNIHLVVDLFGLPLNASYFSNRGFNGVDTSGIAILKYNDFIINCIAAKDSASPCFTLIQGENGYIKIDGPANSCDGIHYLIDDKYLEYNAQAGDKKKLSYEFEDFEEIYYCKNYEECYRLLDESLNVMKVLEMLSQKQPD